jgi:hypothetical protein
MAGVENQLQMLVDAPDHSLLDDMLGRTGDLSSATSSGTPTGSRRLLVPDARRR